MGNLTEFPFNYLTRAASSQVMQDECGAKSVNCLAEFVCVVSSSFILLTPVRGKHVFCWEAAELSKEGVLNRLV